MRTTVVTLSAGAPLAELEPSLHSDRGRGQRLYPVVDEQYRVVGVVTRSNLRAHVAGRAGGGAERKPGGALTMHRRPVVAHPGEPLRVVVYRMAETGLTRFPVVDPAEGGKLLA
jgi:CIC family chloride channel protein